VQAAAECRGGCISGHLWCRRWEVATRRVWADWMHLRRQRGSLLLHPPGGHHAAEPCGHQSADYGNLGFRGCIMQVNLQPLVATSTLL
jgi:hypothetical protein